MGHGRLCAKGIRAMNRVTAILSVSIALGVLQLVTHSALAEAEANVRTMLQAARSLEFDSPVNAQANKAYMLEKQETARKLIKKMLLEAVLHTSPFLYGNMPPLCPKRHPCAPSSRACIADSIPAA
jgi:hypothetical protein